MGRHPVNFQTRNSIFCFYRPQKKFAKVMFLHMSVCPQGGLQAHTQGEVRGSGRGVFRPIPRGGVSRPRPGRCVSQDALRQTPLQQMATAADGMHPTVMHSCL